MIGSDNQVNDQPPRPDGERDTSRQGMSLETALSDQGSGSDGRKGWP